MSYVIVSDYSNQFEIDGHGPLAAEAIETGEMVCILDSDGLVYLADSNDVDKHLCIGMAAHDAAIGEPVTIIDHGLIDGGSSLKEGRPVYLSTTAGGVTQTRPAFAQVVGFAVTTTRWRLHVELGYIASLL